MGIVFGCLCLKTRLVLFVGTPTFGQSAAAGPTPFGSPATPIQSFSSAAPPPFGKYLT